MSKRLAGKTAVVVGAGSSGPGWGNGKATAVLFAREGANVFCVDVNEDAARETAEIVRSEGGTAEAWHADASSGADVERMVASTAFGKFLDRSLRSLTEEAVRDILADAGAQLDDVEAVYFANATAGLISAQEMIRGQAALRRTALLGVPMVNVENACASGSTPQLRTCAMVGAPINAADQSPNLRPGPATNYARVPTDSPPIWSRPRRQDRMSIRPVSRCANRNQDYSRSCKRRSVGEPFATDALKVPQVLKVHAPTQPAFGGDLGGEVDRVCVSVEQLVHQLDDLRSDGSVRAPVRAESAGGDREVRHVVPHRPLLWSRAVSSDRSVG
jgi:hypothetical protein